MLKIEVQKWFRQNGHFAAGLRLLAMTGSHLQLHVRLQAYLRGTWVPDTAKQQLRTALQSWLKEQPDHSHVAPIGSPGIGKPISNIPLPAPVEPPAVLELRKEARTWHKRHSDLKGRLNMMVEDADNHADEQRADIANEIMTEVVPTLDGIYAQIKEFKKTGTIPKPAKERDIVAETVTKMNRIQKILPPRISKIKKYLRDKKRSGKILSAAELQAYEQERLEKETEIMRLKSELGL